ncbi:Las1-like-domain-containing protein [Zychaea mexicana]|uniref:Las1-like-domain-containing protein n=1 Tax=Zychaea mexicana TaxID=64656 RepID=UPI0022FEB08B|nr:Las1-like-domain-containing protein [Zychaea mexicana]KAI9498178.1 Las1-like-domain-containing protein [Zychaea mexicana]
MLRQVPWRTHDELTQVHDWLYSHSKTDIQKGVDRVLAWKARQHLPTAIESTLQFVQLRLRDHQNCTISGEELRLTYSIAIVRLVNGSIDPMQNKARPLPISIMAERINMPAWFVEIRHDATHGYLPTLALLRDAANQALAWIHETYWVPALETDRKPVIDEGKLREIQRGFEIYRKHCTSTQFKSVKKRNEQMPRIREIAMKRLFQIVSPVDIRGGLVPVLLDRGFLVPDDKNKRLAFENNAIPKESIDMWIPLLETLSEKFDDFGVSLMAAMLERLESQIDFVLNDEFGYLLSEENHGSSLQRSEVLKSKSYMLTIAYWLKHIIYHDFSKEEENPIFVGVDLEDIVEGCLRSPNYFTRIVLQAIAEAESDEPFFSLKPVIDAIGRILSNYTSSSIKKVNDSDASTEHIPMDIDMEGELRELASQLQSIRGQDPDEGCSSAWQLYNSTEWTPTPIGCLPGGIVPSLDLPDK